MKKPLLLAAIVFISFSFTGEKNAYGIFDAKGKTTSYAEILKAAKEADIVMFGELHDDPIGHWLQLELTKDLYDVKKEKLVLGAEMFEADDQVVLDEYLRGAVTEKTFKVEAKLWPNYDTDYKPLVEFAKKHQLKFVAANIPRRYANMVYSRGIASLDSVDAAGKKFIAPLPIKYDGELKCYKDIYMSAGGHGGENLPKSQAVKDATMAHFILQNWKPGNLFLHFNGAYHSNNHEGIVWYLRQSKPELKIVVISSSIQKSVDTLEEENKGTGDFIIVTPEGMTRTH